MIGSGNILNVARERETGESMNRRGFIGTTLASLVILPEARSALANTPADCSSRAGFWVMHRRPRDYQAAAGRTRAIKADDLALVGRLLKGYRRSFKAEHYGGGMWKEFFEKRHGAMHKVFMTGPTADAAKFLRDPASSDLHYGFDSTVIDFTKSMESSAAAQDGNAANSKMTLVTLAEALGVARLDYPEAYDTVKTSPPGPPTDRLLKSIDRALGVKVDFPNPFPNEFGLATDRGVAGYRAIQALYQAYRIRAVLAGVQNPKILEIGAGTGRTAYYCYRMGLKDYTIVDLPFTGISQGYFLGRTLGDTAVIIEGEASKPEGVKLLSPDAFFSAKTRYDLIVNVDSLTEIPEAIARRYWQEIKRRAKTFLSINHETNERTVAEIAQAAPLTRFPYWMRRGYAEELYVTDHR